MTKVLSRLKNEIRAASDSPFIEGKKYRAKTNIQYSDASSLTSDQLKALKDAIVADFDANINKIKTRLYVKDFNLSSLQDRDDLWVYIPKGTEMIYDGDDYGNDTFIINKVAFDFYSEDDDLGKYIG